MTLLSMTGCIFGGAPARGKPEKQKPGTPKGAKAGQARHGSSGGPGEGTEDERAAARANEPERLAGAPRGPRVVASTRHDLRALVEGRVFRADVYSRLRDCVVRLPPLRHRKEDIVPLTNAFLRAYAEQRIPATTDAYMLSLCTYAWPYNVGELEATVRRSLALAGGGRSGASICPKS